MGEALGVNFMEMLWYMVNFLLLVGILGKFLYKPYIKHMQERKQSIKDAIDHADIINKRADEKMSSYDKRISRLEEEGREIIKAAGIKAEDRAKSIIEDANRKAEEMMAKARREIEREREEAAAAMREQIGILAIAAAEKILEEQISISGQDKIVDKILKEAGVSE